MNSVISKMDDIVYKWSYYRNAIMNKKTAWAVNLSKENDAIFFNYILAGENGKMYGIILTDSMSKPNIVRINDKFGIDQYSRHKLLSAKDWNETNLLIVDDGLLKAVTFDWIKENADLLTSEAVKNM
jgi:serine protease inhibitor